MRFNGAMARLCGRRVVLLSAVLALVAAGCGRSGDQYLESPDGQVFAKVPDRFEVTDLGAVAPALSEDGRLLGLPGDTVSLPWRAFFGPSQDLDRVSGWIDVQPVDSRVRSQYGASSLLGFDPDNFSDEIEVYSRTDVVHGDLEGQRIVYRPGEGDEQRLMQVVAVADIRNSVVIAIRAGCSLECYEANEELIGEIVDSLYVKDLS